MKQMKIKLTFDGQFTMNEWYSWLQKAQGICRKWKKEGMEEVAKTKGHGKEKNWVKMLPNNEMAVCGKDNFWATIPIDTKSGRDWIEVEFPLKEENSPRRHLES